jgi:hypothetical protein
MGVTISMFLDWKKVGKELTELGACYSLVKALRHFGLCFNKLFCAPTPTVFNPDPNCFLTIVSAMSNQLLVGGGSPDSLEGVAMNFLVWATDKKFAQFAKVASLKDNQPVPTIRRFQGLVHVHSGLFSSCFVGRVPQYKFGGHPSAGYFCGPSS